MSGKTSGSGGVVIGVLVVIGAVGAATHSSTTSTSSTSSAAGTSSQTAPHVESPAAPASPSTRASVETDENKPCSVGGLSGLCLDVSACSGTHTAGYCPYSGDNVQCCTASAPEVQPAEPEGLLCCDGSLSPSCSCGGPHRGCCSHHGGICGCR